MRPGRRSSLETMRWFSWCTWGLFAGVSFAFPAATHAADAADPPPLASSERWISPAELFAAAAGELEISLRQRAKRVESEMPRDGARGLVVDAGPVELTARPLPPGQSLSSRVSIWVDVKQAGVSKRTVLVPVIVHAWQDGLIALRDLPAGTRLDPDHVRPAEVDIAAGGSAAWQGEAAGQLLSTRVLAGHYIGTAQITSPRAVSRGESIQLVHRLGAVEVVANARALQDGDPGQHIQVRPGNAQGPVMARVIEPGMVELMK